MSSAPGSRKPGPPAQPLAAPTGVNHGLQVTVFTLLFGVAIPLMALHEMVTQGWESRLVLIGAALLAGPPAWIFLLESRFRITVSGRGVEARSLVGERRFLPWKAIRRVEFGAITRTLILYTGEGDSGVTLRVSLLRRGVESLGRAIPHYLADDVYAEAWNEMFAPPRR
ncbi:MAG: PH domain-containing protein [Gemmatimonadales bacterium]|nr:MAG: PH domain-containing protein [Gemmatimonadales bacterium]